LALPGVVIGFSPVVARFAVKAITAVWHTVATERTRSIAGDAKACGSIFKREEDSVSSINLPIRTIRRTAVSLRA
jgi:hypothetical protein